MSLKTRVRPHTGRLARGLAVFTALVATGAVAALPSPAAPAESTEQYVEKMERVCKRDFQRSSPIARGTRRLISRGRYRPAASRIARTTRIFKGTIRRTRVIEPASTDKGVIQRWYRQLDIQVRDLNRLARVVRAGNKKKIFRLENRLMRGMNRANMIVFRLGFDRCKIPLDMFGP